MTLSPRQKALLRLLAGVTSKSVEMTKAVYPLDRTTRDGHALATRRSTGYTCERMWWTPLASLRLRRDAAKRRKRVFQATAGRCC